MARSAVTWPVYPPESFDASGFDWIEYMKQFPEVGLTRAAGRRNLTRFNPLLFALIYFRHHLASDATFGEITFSDFHLESCHLALDWARPMTKPKQYRHALVAPRETGKSTWWFLILPMWAAAHGHVKFLAAYSDTATQAERHLSTFKRELETNVLLRNDFRELSEPLKKDSGHAVADNQNMIQTRNGFVFTAAGLTSGTLGLKVGSLRPDLLILDDVEPGESDYSLNQMAKRLSTIQDVIFPLNLHAKVVLTGTVTMPGSIMHQLVNSVTTTEKPPSWIAEENVKVHYFAPLIDTDDGDQRSLWPSKWPVEFLRGIQHTRSYSKNFANQPIGADGTYWTEDSFHRTDNHQGAVTTYLSIDPSVTGTKKSDFTGIAVVSYIPPGRGQFENPAFDMVNPEGLKGTAIVRHLSHVRMSPGPELRTHVLKIMAEHPDIRILLIETNQGGDTWKTVFHQMPVEVVTIHQSIGKEIRAAQLLTDYEMGRVLHEGRFHDGEQEMMGFPFGSNDDMVDAVGTAVQRLREQEALRSAAKKAANRGPRHSGGSYGG